jgi:hypothetical protein
VKRKIIVLAFVAVVGVTVYVGTCLRAAQQNDPGVQQVSVAPQAPPRTKIAIINLQQVVMEDFRGLVQELLRSIQR